MYMSETQRIQVWSDSGTFKTMRVVGQIKIW